MEIRLYIGLITRLLASASKLGQKKGYRSVQYQKDSNKDVCITHRLIALSMKFLKLAKFCFV